MKIWTNNWLKLSLIIVLISVFSFGNVSGQKLKTSRLRVEYIKDLEAERVVATLIVKEKKYEPLRDAEIQFYNIHDTSRVLLHQIMTNEEGQAIYIIDDNEIFKDSAGLMTFEITYAGNDLIKPASKEIEVQQSLLDVSFSQKDSIKYINVAAKAIGSSGQVDPIEELDITFYVKGTFSLLNIGKETTDENGEVKIEFPVDMPGDTVGILSLVVKIEDNDLYGNVESKGQMNWGVPVPLPKEKQRGLGDTDAPLWMVYTLIVLLSIVWSQYLYVIYMIVKIKLSNRSLTT